MREFWVFTLREWSILMETSTVEGPGSEECDFIQCLCLGLQLMNRLHTHLESRIVEVPVSISKFLFHTTGSVVEEKMRKSIKMERRNSSLKNKNHNSIGKQ
ncbi:unnamed protein product [Lactuca virosa]|uniref:Uncharacterized protein n=1 Tax=Lactuca virosa TaxID=75947 RepID=A0AAU9NRZ3_9ASTR|nr:unnamed protein product [Lactuca virosa]